MQLPRFVERLFLAAGVCLFLSNSLEAQITSPYYINVGTGNDVVTTGLNSIAVGYGTQAESNYSVSLGYANTAAGSGGAICLGYWNVATGVTAATIGYGNTASGYAALGCNSSTTAIGNYASSFGYYTKAQSYEELVLGQYNLYANTTLNATGVTSTDPIFEIGNGTASTALADAFIVYKNGNTQAHGTIRCAAGGDLSMGSFTAGTAP